VASPCCRRVRTSADMVSALDMTLDDVINKKGGKKPAGKANGAKAARPAKANGAKVATTKKEKKVSEPKGTEAKLEMSLEDLVQNQVSKGAGKRARADGSKKIIGGPGKFARRQQQKAEGGKAQGKGAARTERKGKGKGKRQRQDEDWEPKGKGKSKGWNRLRWEDPDAWYGGGKGDGWGRKGSKGGGKGGDYSWDGGGKSYGRKGGGKERYYEDEWDDYEYSKGKGGYGKGRSSKGDWEREERHYEDKGKGGSKGGGKYDWSAAGFGKRKTADDWEPPAKRARAEEPRGRGHLRSTDEGSGDRDRFWGGGGAAKGGGRDRAHSGGSEWSKEKNGLSGGDRDAPPPRGGSTKVRVSNVPKNLDWRDIKEAFSDQGRVIRCEVDRGIAYLEFENAADAKKAVQTFDRGEMNGQTINVTVE